MKNITHAEWTGGYLNIVHEDSNDNFPVDFVRGGFLWPSAESPGYLCILGQRPKYNDARRKPLILIAEHVCDLPKKLIETISAETRRLLCRSFYSDSCERTWNHEDDLDAYVKKFGLGRVTLDPPYLKDWINGILSAKQWMVDDALEVPEGSILREQLSRMTIEDQDESRRGPLFAVDALRCVLGSFELPISQPITIKQSGYVYA